MKAKMNRCQQGFSLVEVMVSVLVLSGGLLGLAFLQAQGMKFNAEAYQRTQATVLAYDIIDRLRANPTAAHGDAYVVASSADAYAAETATHKSCDKPDGTVKCDADELATFDLAKWYEVQGKTLAINTSNRATIARAAVNSTLDQHTVTMHWLEHETTKTQQWVVQLNVP
jgi:type IV pilus assembly protein PilV